jgi:hypothetical protein
VTEQQRESNPSSCATFTLENHAFSRVFYAFLGFYIGVRTLGSASTKIYGCF